MGETEFHVAVIFYLFGALREWFRRAEKTYVAANMLFYYEEGNPQAVMSPDVFVVKGVAKHKRRTYKLWEEKAAPCAVFEITSRSSRIEDITKKGLYEMLGVREYFLFDPLGEYLRPRFQAFELDGGYYRPMVLAADGTLPSRELDLILRPEGEFLRLVDPATRKPLPDIGEAIERAQEETRRADEEARRAEEEARRAEEEARRAEEEARGKQAAEAEIARLRAEIERLRRGR